MAFVHLGCEKNLVDTEHMMGLLCEGGYGVTSDPDDASLVVVNTCSFIQEAREESVKALVELYGTQVLFRRSLIALFGTGGILNIFYSPLILQFSRYLGEGDLLIEAQFPFWFTLATLLVALWSIIIMAHIFSRLISNPSYSVLITLFYLMVNFVLQTSIAGM